jgi:hypothetical protein
MLRKLTLPFLPFSPIKITLSGQAINTEIILKTLSKLASSHNSFWRRKTNKQATARRSSLPRIFPNAPFQKRRGETKREGKFIL